MQRYKSQICLDYCCSLVYITSPQMIITGACGGRTGAGSRRRKTRRHSMRVPYEHTFIVGDKVIYSEKAEETAQSQICPKVCDYCKAQYIPKESSSAPAGAAAAVPDAFISKLNLGLKDLKGSFCSGDCRISCGLTRQARTKLQKQKQIRTNRRTAVTSDSSCAKKPWQEISGLC